MSRLQLLLFFVFTFCASATAQLELSPSQIFDWPDEPLQLEEYYFTLFNASDQDKSIMMTYEKVCVPEGWITQLCDSLLCFSPSLDTVIIAIPAMSTWNMGLTLTGENVEEGAIYTFKVADNNNLEDEEVSWLYLNIENCDGTPLSVENQFDDKPSISFENRAIIFDQTRSYQLTTITGEKIKSSANPAEKVDIQSLQRGFYFLTLDKIWVYKFFKG